MTRQPAAKTPKHRRRALATLPILAVALAAAAAPAGAAVVETLPCVQYSAGEASMPIMGMGFSPNGLATLSTTTPSNPNPAPLTASPLDAAGAFSKAAMPPLLDGPNVNQQSFNLIATDTTNPAAPVQAAPIPFQVVRFGMTMSPVPKRPAQVVTFTARGFTPGKPVYVHFRFRGRTQRTVRLGVASGPCGIVSKRMRAMPTTAYVGQWATYTNQSTQWSGRPAWKLSFPIYR